MTVFVYDEYPSPPLLTSNFLNLIAFQDDWNMFWKELITELESYGNISPKVLFALFSSGEKWWRDFPGMRIKINPCIYFLLRVSNKVYNLEPINGIQLDRKGFRDNDRIVDLIMALNKNIESIHISSKMPINFALDTYIVGTGDLEGFKYFCLWAHTPFCLEMTIEEDLFLSISKGYSDICRLYGN